MSERQDLEKAAAEARGYDWEYDVRRGDKWCSFHKGARRVWATFNGWTTADLKDGRYENHRKYDNLIEALQRGVF